MAGEYLPRFADAAIAELLLDVGAVLILGARATGKTTTAQRHAASVVRLDDPLVAEVFRAGPDAALRRLPEPVLLDEWQAVPEVLGAVKRSVDEVGSGAGRFLISGSVRDDMLGQSRPITGRVFRVEMTGLGMREVRRGDLAVAPFLDRLAAHALTDPDHTPDLVGYAELALGGGYPEPILRLTGRRRRGWLEGYLDRVMTRDALEVDVPRDPALMARYFAAYARNTAGEAADRTLWEAAGISRMTAEAYERLFTTLMLVETVPAWSTNRLKRLIRGPKRFVRDSGLAAAAMDVDIDDVMRDGDVLGRLIETFVLTQLRAEQCRFDRAPRLFHFRQYGGLHEVDLVVEMGYRKLVGIEVKSSGAVNPHDARHLSWLRDELGEDFVAGVVLHTGPRAYPLGDRIVAAPISTIWS